MNKDKLIEDNMNLVYYIIHREYPTFSHDEDIIQSGMVGLCNAAKSWDSEKGKFSTYAGRCIRNEIYKEFINRKPHSKNISLNTKLNLEGELSDIIIGEEDVSLSDNLSFMEQLVGDELTILNYYDYGYTTKEIAEKTGFTVNKTQSLLRTIKLKWRSFNDTD